MNYDKPFTDKQIKEYTTGHVNHLKDLDARGILHICGPLKDVDREMGMIILNALSLDEAKDYAFKDPFVVNKCYKTCNVYEINEANAENNFLLG